MRTYEARLVETRIRRNEEMRGDQNRKMILLEGLERKCSEVNEEKRFLLCDRRKKKYLHALSSERRIRAEETVQQSNLFQTVFSSVL